MGFNSAFRVKIVKNPGNGRLKNLNDPVLNVLIYIVLYILTSFVPTFSHCCKNLGSQKCALTLDVPHTWFNNWPDDDSLSRNMSPL